MTRVLDGHEIATLYTSVDRPPAPTGAPGRPPFVRGIREHAQQWQIRQRHVVDDAAGANAAVLADLAGGVEAIELAACSPGTLPEVLHGVMLGIAPISFAANADGECAWALMNVWSAAGIADADVSGSFGVDPLAVVGKLDPAGEAALASAATASAERFPNVRSVGVDTSFHARDGASPGTELGLSMATATEYLRALDGAGLAINEAAGEFEFTYLATADQFVTMAKLRAARRLWHRVVEVCGGSPASAAQQQRAVTAAVAADDPWTHVLRSTTACFAAGAGGAAAITVVPFTVKGTDYHPALAARLARNTHHLLLDESHVAEVVDPGGGSPYIETLTDVFARSGWTVFQSIEAAGGLSVVAESGGIDELIAP